MVITYNPSHSNINSEVNAPFKMLSLMLRFLDNETKPTNKRPIRQPIEDYDDDQPGARPNPSSAFGNFSMPRKEEELQIDSGARMDTYNDDEDDYDDEHENGGRKNFGDLADEDRLSVNLDDIQDDESDEDTIDLTKSAAATQGVSNNQEESKDEAVNTSGSDDNNKSTGGSSGSGSASTGNLFAVGES